VDGSVRRTILDIAENHIALDDEAPSLLSGHSANDHIKVFSITIIFASKTQWARWLTLLVK
jgi:hypothetical protein